MLIKKFLLVKIAFLTFFSAIICKHNVIPELEDLTPDIKTLLDEKTKQRKQDKSCHIDNEADLDNIEILLTWIKDKNQPMGVGEFGNTFVFNGESPGDVNVPQEIAAKVKFVNEDYDTEEGKVQQEMLLNELKIDNYVMSKDPKHIYFLNYMNTYDATAYFKKSIGMRTSNEVADFLRKKDKKNTYQTYVIFMEKMDMELEKYWTYIFERRRPKRFNTRLRMFETLSQSLINIIDKITHCNLRDSNIMLQEISKDQSDQLATQGVLQLELKSQQYYLLKIIDFGVAKFGPRDSRQCTHGTDGYSSLEFYEDDSTANVDVFNLMVMMLTGELMSMTRRDKGIIQAQNQFNLVNSAVVELIVNDTLDGKTKQTYLLTVIHHYLMFMWERSDYKTVLLQYLEEYDSQIFNEISKEVPCWKTEPIEENIFIEPNFFRAMVASTVRACFEYYFPKDIILVEITEFKEKKEKLEKEIESLSEDTEDYKIKQDQINYYKLMMEIEVKEMQRKQELVKFLLSIFMTADFKVNLTMEEFHAKINGFRLDYENNYGDKLQTVNELIEYYLLDNDFDESNRTVCLETYKKNGGELRLI
jgi:serine/threonine protein kinase